MVWRITILSWVLALLAGMVVYFSAEIVQLFSLGAHGATQLLNWSELAAIVLAIVGTLGLCIKLLQVFVLSSYP